MSGEPYDVQGEVRDALSTAVSSYGKRVLSDPRVLGNLVTDLLPDHPRERSLLVTAAEGGIAGELTQNVEGQRMDADTAVALAARSLTENRSLDPAASTWVATEYARALGYQVSAQAPPPAWGSPAPAWGSPSPAWGTPLPAALQDSGHAPTMTTNQPANTWPPAATPPASPWGQASVPPTQAPPSPWPAPASPAASFGAGSGTPVGPGSPAAPASPWQPGQGAPGGPWPAPPAQPQSPRRGLFLGAGFVAVVVVLYLIAAAVTSVFPFSGSKSGGTAAPVASSSPVSTSGAGTASPAARSTPTAQAAAGVKQLKVLMPYDLADVNTECVAQAKIPFNNPGLVRALDCVAPDMANGQVFGYQLDSHADYLKAWANYNSWAQFGTSSTLNCPPASGDSQGGPGEWWGPRFDKRAGQVLECFTSSTGPVYVWTYPSEDAFVVAQPPKTWTFSKLETWWEDNAV